MARERENPPGGRGMLWLVLALAVVPGGAWGQTPEAQAAGTLDVPAVGVLESPLPVAGTSQPPFALLPAAVGVVPGLVLHGLGPLVAGDTQTAVRSFVLEGVGLGMLFGGGVPIALSGASRRVIGPLYAVTLTGMGLLSISTLSALYGAVGPAFPAGMAPQRLPPLELELGYQHVIDPAFRYRHFASVGVLARVERVRLEAGARMSPDDGNLRVRVGGAYRVLGGPEGARGGADGTAVDLEAAALAHRYPAEGFSLGGGELFLRGRYDMARFSPRMAGSFAELGVGMAVQRYVYEGPTDDILFEQILYTIGYGVYLGRGGPFRGEALLYYDHRKDDFPGGIKAWSGVPGYLGLRGRVLLTERWGVAADVQMGSVPVGRLSLVYALGGEP